MHEESDFFGFAIFVGDGDGVLTDGAGFVDVLLLAFLEVDRLDFAFFHVRSMDGDLHDFIGDGEDSLITNGVIEGGEELRLAIVDKVTHKRNEVVKKRKVGVVEVEVEDDLAGAIVGSSDEDRRFLIRGKDGGEIVDERILHVLLEKDVTVHANTTGKGVVEV